METSGTFWNLLEGSLTHFTYLSDVFTRLLVGKSINYLTTRTLIISEGGG